VKALSPNIDRIHRHTLGEPVCGWFDSRFWTPLPKHSVFNSVYFLNYKFTSEGFTICTHTASLTFDLTSDQEKLPRKRRRKKVKKPSGEQQRRIPLQNGQKQ